MQIPRPVHHEVTKLTKIHEKLFVQDRFVSLRGLRAFVIHRICLISWLLLIAPAQESRAGETIDRVLALVAGQLITLTDVTAARDLGLVSVDAAADPVRAVLSKLIDRELILAEADRYAPPEPDAEAVQMPVGENGTPAREGAIGSGSIFSTEVAMSLPSSAP